MKKIITALKNWFLEENSVSNWNEKAYRALKNRCHQLCTLSDEKLLDLKKRVDEKCKIHARLIHSAFPICRAQVVGCCFAYANNQIPEELAYWQGVLKKIEKEIFWVRKLKIEEP